MSPDPRILDVARAGARGEKDNVDADVLAIEGIAGHENLSRRGDAGEALVIDREIKFGDGGTRLHLDEGDEVAALGDQIDLAGWGPHALIEDPPAA